MRRSQEDRDVLVLRYEGLAVRVAVNLWAVYGWQMGSGGAGLDDVVQEARLILLDVVGRVDLRRRGRRSYVARMVAGRLRHRFLARGPRRVHQDKVRSGVELGELPAKSEETSGLSVYIKGKNDRLFCELVLSGMTVDKARLAVGWTRADYAAAKGRLRRILEHDGRDDDGCR